MGTGTGVEYLCVSSADLSAALAKLASNKNAPFLLVDKDTGALRVSLAPGTSSISSASYGVTSYRNTALSNAAQAVKASAGNIFSVQIINTNPSAVFVKLYDIAAASVVVGTSAVKRTLLCPGGSLANPGYVYLHGDALPLFSNFGTAIAVAATANLADNDTAAPTAAINVNIIYV